MSADIGSHDTANGGKGIDTLQLQLTQQQFNSAAVQADLTAYNAFLARTRIQTATPGRPSISRHSTCRSPISSTSTSLSSTRRSSSAADRIEYGHRAGQHHRVGCARHHADDTRGHAELHRRRHRRHPYGGGDTGVHVESVPAATQTDLATAVTTVLRDSTGTGSGSIDWNFAIPDKDLDFLSAGQTLTVNSM